MKKTRIPAFAAIALAVALATDLPSEARADAKADAAQAQENLAYAVGVQAYLYGQQLMDLYRTFWKGTLDPKRGPVAAFWSLTMYDAKIKLFVDNKSNRYSIGDRTAGIKTGKNGSLTITMSSAEPSGADAKANWLPTPKGAFYVVLREYSPGPAVLNGDWLPSKIEKAK